MTDCPPTHNHHTSRQEKKCCAVTRGKRHHLINLMAWQHESSGVGSAIAAPTGDDSLPPEVREPDDEEMSWTERSDKTRNRLTGKRKKAKGRWAGFASSSGGPSKGR
ncbi:MAG: hypothetical protein FJX23_08650 [Alphaproteobacteria bacterium]|nr:hypothetical protein [Alphaproteobacteria bacterium]